MNNSMNSDSFLLHVFTILHVSDELKESIVSLYLEIHGELQNTSCRANVRIKSIKLLLVAFAAGNQELQSVNISWNCKNPDDAVVILKS